MRVLYQTAAGFEAARSLSIAPADHPVNRLHGHSFGVRLRAAVAEGFGGFPGAELPALATELGKAIAPLDYSLLNDHLPMPGDEHLAEWLWQKVRHLHPESLGISSGASRGVDIDTTGRQHRWHRFRFEAAHQLPNVPAGHQCGRMHGHGFEVLLHVDSSPVASSSTLLDYDEITACWNALHQQLHLKCLNDIPGLENPTSEMLAAWIWARLQPQLPGLSWLTVYETATAGCHFDGRHYRIWKEMRFESALRLPQAPAGHELARLHGHSYRLRLHLSAPLDSVLGWTVDYGEVKAKFTPIYQILDHNNLMENNEIEYISDKSLCLMIHDRLLPELPQLDRVDVFQRSGCGVIASWGALGPALPG